jgi:hypothetical protein
VQDGWKKCVEEDWVKGEILKLNGYLLYNVYTVHHDEAIFTSSE